jgi:hypothetical protein
MAPRQITDTIAQRASRTVATAALALGLIATTFAPSSAFAAPAQAARPDLVPDYGGGHRLGAETGPGKPMWMYATVRNVGGQTAHGARLVVSIPAQMTDVTVNGSPYFVCSRNPGTRGKTVIVCDTDEDLAPNRTIGIELEGARPPMPGDYEVVVAVDPDNAVSESDELNNTKIFPLVTHFN